MSTFNHLPNLGKQQISTHTLKPDLTGNKKDAYVIKDCPDDPWSDAGVKAYREWDASCENGQFRFANGTKYVKVNGQVKKA